MQTMDLLSPEEQAILLKLARQAIEEAVNKRSLPPLQTKNLPERLLQKGATFVTLTRNGELRGCIGALEPRTSLVEDVREHAVSAALQDYRFPPVQVSELPEIEIEISRLTLPEDLVYDSPQDLPNLIRPNVDGVTLIDGWRRATFLPQVWEKIPDPIHFLSNLCLKMGAASDLWLRKKIRVQIYQVQEFHEK